MLDQEKDERQNIDSHATDLLDQIREQNARAHQLQEEAKM